ncbi:prenyltransferase/squalene oxidase repeat-containing protein [Actinomadura vinacea]|uniref:Prenyltransferase/squalene oxidase repeat-containing protein n=1 Tax=Actinomadura vinacea TaxID=115336 RepID=A0ABN3K1K5_9ACTN
MTAEITKTITNTARARAGLAAALDGVFAAQRPDGSWQGVLPSSAVSTGSAVIALHAADESPDLVASGARWLREAQEPDGGWGDAPGGPSTLNATAIAVAALRIVEGPSDAVSRGLERIEAFGGMDAVGDRERCTLKAVCQQYLAEAGLYPAERLARMPYELLLAPAWLRNKLSFTVPGLAAWGVMQGRTWSFGPVRRLVNRFAEPRALAYLDGIRRYEGPSGGVEESPLMASIVAFGYRRAGLRPVPYLDYLRGTVRPDGSWPIDRDIEFSVSVYLVQAMFDAGLEGDERLRRIEPWIRGAQRPAAFAPTGCPPGGWGWSMPSGWPDTDDTSGAVAALAGFGAGKGDPSLRRGVSWLLRMQNRDGSWGCFTRNARVSMDAPCAVMTAHAVLALWRAGAREGATARAVRWFARAQRADGSFATPWFRNYTTGTARVLEALSRLGLSGTPTGVRARDWLLAHQHPDGGWGDGRGAAATVEETAWALIGLIGAGHADDPAVARGIDWLLRHQREDGLWEPAIVGVYFLDLTYWCDHFANAYALQALALYTSSPEGGGG